MKKTIALALASVLALSMLAACNINTANVRPDGSTAFMSYAGAVFPLSVLDDADGITASRNITFDFSGFGETRTNGNTRLHHSDIPITDSYILTNKTADDKTVQLVYPFAGNFANIYKLIPNIAVDGNMIETELAAGSYSGDFSGAGSREGMNLRFINSWEDYVALLSDGTYLKRALSDAPVLDQPVTVYRFSNARADHSKDPAATLAVRFSLDYDKTTVLTYGFNGGEFGRADGFQRRSFFVPNEINPWFGRNFYMIVIGEDIQNLTMQGYKNGGCRRGDEVDHVSADMERYEAVLGDVLLYLFNDFFNAPSGCFCEDCANGFTTPAGHLNENIDIAMLYRAAVELLLDYGALSDSVIGRYDTGMLEDIFSEARGMDRVFYLTAEVEIPAGESVSIDVSFIKPGSFDFFFKGSRNIGLYGYDILTTLGSNLLFESTTATIVGSDRIEIVRQSFGFDLGNGVLSVALDAEKPHFFLEVRGAAN